MQEKSLKEKSVSALFWSFVEKGGQQIIQFVFLLFLAGMLSPKEFGLIAILAIFSAIANILQDSGFSSALVRKKDITEQDYSTVFYFNLAISILIYLVLFFVAPIIARFYDEPVLTNLSRFIFLAFLFNSFAVIQNVHLVRALNFKISSQVSLASSLVSGLIAMFLAFRGYGVWSLAAQQVIQAFLRSALLICFVKWKPHSSFCSDTLKSMFSYSSKLLLTNLLNQVTSNMYANVIAKKFTSTNAGYFAQADRFAKLPQSILATTLQSVAFPLLNKVGDDKERQKRIFRKIIRVVSFACFPIAMVTFTAAESAFFVLWGDKWLPVVPLLYILVIGFSFVALFYLLASLLQSLGRSGLLLKIETTRNLLSLGTLIFTIQFGVIPVVWGITVVYVVCFVWGYFVAGKTIKYSLFEVFRDVTPYIVISAVSFLPFYFLKSLITNDWIFLFVAIIGGVVLYLCILKVLGSKVVDDFAKIVTRKDLN